jgi:hypothetical protein
MQKCCFSHILEPKYVIKSGKSFVSSPIYKIIQFFTYSRLQNCRAATIGSLPYGNQCKAAAARLLQGCCRAVVRPLQGCGNFKFISLLFIISWILYLVIVCFTWLLDHMIHLKLRREWLLCKAEQICKMTLKLSWMKLSFGVEIVCASLHNSYHLFSLI